jgi:hypothetical protein
MRTMVSISDELLTAAKRLAHERGQTLGQSSSPPCAWSSPCHNSGASGRSFPSSPKALGRGPVSTSPRTGP